MASITYTREFQLGHFIQASKLQPMLITGSMGTGKSTALAVLLWRWLAHGHHAWVISEYEGHGPFYELAMRAQQPTAILRGHEIAPASTQLALYMQSRHHSESGYAFLANQLDQRRQDTDRPPTIALLDTQRLPWVTEASIQEMNTEWLDLNVAAWIVQQEISREVAGLGQQTLHFAAHPFRSGLGEAVLTRSQDTAIHSRICPSEEEHRALVDPVIVT